MLENCLGPLVPVKGNCNVTAFLFCFYLWNNQMFPAYRIHSHSHISSHYSQTWLLKTCFIPSCVTSPLQSTETAAAYLFKNFLKFSPVTVILRSIHWLPVVTQIEFKLLVLIIQSWRVSAPHYLCNQLPNYTIAPLWFMNIHCPEFSVQHWYVSTNAARPLALWMTPPTLSCIPFWQKVLEHLCHHCKFPKQLIPWGSQNTKHTAASNHLPGLVKPLPTPTIVHPSPHTCTL